ncbi:discoidin domain-containing protein [Streptomyces sp. NPDC001633]|uniref:discoidin domain-containing protein n=1 Tax=Streptomyces sp. NPDC001633 TaxID=3364595 RepID=UPI0036980A78
MTATDITDLIVPVEVHALLVNERVRQVQPFYRYKPSFSGMLGTIEGTGREAAEPEPFSGGNVHIGEGVHVQWQLPEALTEGVVDEATGHTSYPLVPNRWMVVRYARVRGASKPARGWVVHSDYLYSDDPDGWDGHTAINSFLNPRAQAPEVDWLGNIHALADGPWREPEGDRELFLTAVGAGLPSFAAYQPYHENVFSMHDDLEDLKDPSQGDSYPPDATLSYLVVGWYSDTTEDILEQAVRSPGLLPSDSDGSRAEVLQALGWTMAGRSATTTMGTTEPHALDHILDRRLDTYYLSAQVPDGSSRITIDLGSEQQISAIRVHAGDLDGAHLLPGVRVQTSVDNVDWPAAHHQDFPAQSPVIDYVPTAPFAARYVQLCILQNGDAPVAVRDVEITAAPAGNLRTVYSGTALGLDWQRFGATPEDPDRPENGRQLPIALGHSTGEAAAALVNRQARSPHTAQLFSALYHGTLDTFDGADGDRDLKEITHSSWFSGRDGGSTWQIVPRPTQDTDAPPTRRGADLTPAWLAELNSVQTRHDAALSELTAGQWRVWSLYWLRELLRHLPDGQRPVDVPDDFEETCDWQLNPANDGPAKAVQTKLAELQALRSELPPLGDDQDAIDAWAAGRGLAEHLQLKRLPKESFYKPADPVLLIEGTGGGTVPLTRDSDNPLPCRLPSTLLRGIKLDGVMTPVPENPDDPGIPTLPTASAALLKEFALLERAARTGDPGGTALHDLVEDPHANGQGTLAEFTAPWGQPWLPMFLMWKINFFPTPYRTDEGCHWTFRGPEEGTGLDSYGYTWDGTGTLPADFESEGDVLNRLFRGRSYLAPTTVYVARAQLARYMATYPDADTRALAALREELEKLDILSQSLAGFNDWLLQLDGGAQVPTEGAVARLTGDQNHVPDGAGGPQQRRFQPVRAGQFFFTDLRILDRFGRTLDLVTSGDDGNWYDQYPVRAASVTPSKDLYTEPEVINPERFIQLPPRILQDTRLAFTPVPAAPTEVSQGSPVAGWLLANYLDQTLGIYGPTGVALGEVRVITTVGGSKAADYNPLPHSPYTGRDDEQFKDDLPQLHRFLAALTRHRSSADAFKALLATIDTSLKTTVDPSPEDDHLPVRLIGRPVALIRADLDFEREGPPLTDPSWATVLAPPTADYPEDIWAIRLGDPYKLADGLIGYYSAEPNEDVDYGTLRALVPAGDSAGYIEPTSREDLALPASASGRVTRHVTLLAHPHLPVHATTDILPVHRLQLDADQVHQALAAIRASFRLNPLLATTRSARTAATTIPGDHGNSTPEAGPVGLILDGKPDTWYESGSAPRHGDTVTVDLGSVQPVTGVHVQLGQPGGQRIPSVRKLQTSTDADEWADLAADTANPTELLWPRNGTVAPPLTARYVRLELQASQDTVVIRSVQVTPDVDALVIPPLSARYGTWSWAQPDTTQGDATIWDERALIPADHLTHPDDPNPTARAGYLQLHPATPGSGPEPDRQP